MISIPILPITEAALSEPRDEKILPYLEVETWVYPTKIYKYGEPETPNIANVMLTVRGKGDPVNAGEGIDTADIVFVVDTTGSMNEISDVQNKIDEIVKDIKANITDVQFGLASYRDHLGYYDDGEYAANYGSSGDWPFRIEQDLAKNSQDFEDAVDGLSKGGGGDTPEAVVDAIYHTTHNFTWRGGDVAKIALLMGDAPGHDSDNDYGSWGDYPSTGKCPHGHKMVDVVSDTAKNKVIWATIGMGDTETTNTVGWAQWNYLTEKTGGKYRALGAEDITELIVELIGEVVPLIYTAGENAVVTLVLPSYIEIIEDTIDPAPPSYYNETTYIWELEKVNIDGRKTISFDIQATEAGLAKLLYGHPETELQYLAWNGTLFVVPTIVTFPKTTIDVLCKNETAPPTSAILQPKNNKFYNSMNTISGIASDNTNGSGVNKVEISIQRLNNNCYWDGSDWRVEDAWLVTSGTTIWDFDSSFIRWSSDTQYRVESRAIDFVSNIEIPTNGIVFNIDMERPCSNIDIPIDNTFLNNLNLISGSAYDLGGAGVYTVEISIKQTNNTGYWDGIGWSSGKRWRSVSGTNEWSDNVSCVKWVTDTNYTIYSRAIDNVGNIELPGIGKTFMYDNKPPEGSISINAGDKFTKTSEVVLFIHAEDSGSGIDQIAFSDDNLTWSSWEPFIRQRSFTLPPEDGEKTVYFKVKDLAGNIAEPVFDTIILDSTPPAKLAININKAAVYSNSTQVELFLYAIDLLSGLNEMCFSTDGIEWSDWEAFEYSKFTELPASDGEKIIHLKVNDMAGNIANPVFDSIILDTTPPHSVSFIINNGSMETNSTITFLNNTAYDDLSGVYQMSYSIDGENWTSWELFLNERFFNLTPSDGEKTIYFRVIDLAGNIAKPTTGTILLDTTLPVQEVPVSKKATSKSECWIIYLIIIIVIITVLILMWFRKRSKRVRRPRHLSSIIPKPVASSAQVTAREPITSKLPGKLKGVEVSPSPALAPSPAGADATISVHLPAARAISANIRPGTLPTQPMASPPGSQGAQPPQLPPPAMEQKS